MLEILIKLGPYINYIIPIFAALAAVALYMSFSQANFINKNIYSKDDKKIKALCSKNVTKSYNIFLTLVSLFPFWGMLGTVLSLLGLDITSGDNESLKSSFFLALSTTAWGLLFSILFKLLNSLCQHRIENAIEFLETLKIKQQVNADEE